MKRFLFAVVVAALCASAAPAQPVIVGGPPAPAPVIVGTAGTPVVEYAPAAPARRGLLWRLRNRNNTTTYSAPVMTAPSVIAPAPALTPMPGTIVPAPMPAIRPNGASYYTPDGGIVLAGGIAPGTVVQAGGPMPCGSPCATPCATPCASPCPPAPYGTVMAADSMVIPAGYTEPAPMRRGLIGRLRNR
jgi:hypothetical protein